METRPCVRCGEPFPVNRRASEFHLHCAKDECQSERKRLAQKARRAKQGCPVLGPKRKRIRAGYMAAYRQEHAAYRRRERDAARRRRVVTEAG